MLVKNTYIGRFAPSPTGPLHFGSLVAAVASFLEAKSREGLWLLRMEDLDQPREVPGAADSILKTLEVFGFKWDGAVMYQSQRQQAYAAALHHLQQDHFVYPCACTRKEIADSAIHGIDGLIYPGKCRDGLLSGQHARAWRIRAEATITFNDAIQGSMSQDLARDIGDFVLKRADGLFAYQLAVVVDDAEQGISHIVRGADLLDSTPRQIYLQQKLGFRQPQYAHIPVATNAQGEKLSKQTLALALNANEASKELWQALYFLGQHPPAALRDSPLSELWRWAYENWNLSYVAKTRSGQDIDEIQTGAKP
ncbi:MAG TPA: tRNA glutamyl-Q(34) synthetase GluQRS [Methylophilaceae bacterium]|nr:tRNA glutamyl-Q(34) synthetase GluQRS [Methylophilaceae bacterium]